LEAYVVFTVREEIELQFAVNCGIRYVSKGHINRRWEGKYI